jgi:DNA mismatch endonuclease (patch repair protein)
MTDKLSKAHRSWLMSRVPGKNTKPEILARSLLHRLGYRFTVNGPKNKKLPGKPDIVLPKYKTALFIHGCFWHRHQGCKHATTPQSNTEYWLPKFERNVQRDRENERRLRELGWKPVVVWECELRNLDTVAAKLIAALPRGLNYALPEDLDDESLVAESEEQYGRRERD